MFVANNVLSQLTPGKKARVRSFPSTKQGQRSLRSRLISVGLTPGTEFEVVRYAPLGDPVQINVRGLLVALRLFEMDALSLELV